MKSVEVQLKCYINPTFRLTVCERHEIKPAGRHQNKTQALKCSSRLMVHLTLLLTCVCRGEYTSLCLAPKIAATPTDMTITSDHLHEGVSFVCISAAGDFIFS